MINMKKIIISFLFSVTFFSCNSNETSRDINNPKYEVDIDALKKKDFATTSSYFKSVRPIFLETSENCLIQSINEIQVTDDYIFILDYKYERLYCFDKEGKFVRKIGNLGSGPGEFSSITDFTIDKDGTIYTVDWHRIHSYTLSGEYISSFELKNIGFVGHIQVVGDFLYLYFQPERILLDKDLPLLLKVDKKSGEVAGKYLSSHEHNLGFQCVTFKDGSFFYPNNSYAPCFAPIYSSMVFSLNNNGVSPYFRISSKRLLRKGDLEGLDLSRPVVTTKINRIHKIKTIRKFLEVDNYIFCEYMDDYTSGSDMLLYSKNSGEAYLYNVFFDDYFYETAAKASKHHFACSDEKGIYAFIPVLSVPLFINNYESGNIKYGLSKKQHNHLKQFSEEMNPPLFYYELKD